VTSDLKKIEITGTFKAACVLGIHIHAKNGTQNKVSYHALKLGNYLEFLVMLHSLPKNGTN